MSSLSPFACAGCSHKARPSRQRSRQVEKCWILRIFCCNLLCPHLWSLLTCSSLCYVVKAPALHIAGPVQTESKSKASFPSASQVIRLRVKVRIEFRKHQDWSKKRHGQLLLLLCRFGCCAFTYQGRSRLFLARRLSLQCFNHLRRQMLSFVCTWVIYIYIVFSHVPANMQAEFAAGAQVGALSSINC